MTGRIGKAFLVIAVLTACFSHPATVMGQEETPPNAGVAVLPVTAPEIPYLDVDRLTEALFKAVNKAGLTPTTVSRQDSPLFRENCIDLACLTRLGRKLGVLRVVSVRVTPVGRFYALSLRVANVADARIEAARQERIESQDDLGNAIARMSHEAVRGMLAETGKLRISTVPRQCAIYLNNNSLGLSPLEVELPAGEYAVRAARAGFGDSEARVRVVAGDTVSLALTLALPSAGLDQRNRRIPTRLLLWGGLPIQSRGSLIGNQLGMGGMLLYGNIYRLGFGASTHRQILDVDEPVWRNYGAVKAPEGWSMVIHALFIVAPRGDKLTPLFGLGLAGIQREVIVSLQASEDTWENQMEFGAVLLAGVDIPVYRRFFLELTLIKVVTSGTNPAKQEYSTPPDQVWIDSFDALSSFASLRFTIGVNL